MTAKESQFNKDGTKMFLSYQNDSAKDDDSGDDDFIAEYTFPHLLIFQQLLMLAIVKDVTQLTQIMMVLLLGIMQQQNQ